jgi:hypothetical protein
VDVPGQQFLDAVDGMVGDTRQHLAQIGFGIDTVEFRRTNQAVDRRRPLPASIRSGKQVVLSAQSHAPQRAFGSVVVDFDVAIFYIAGQCLPAGECVADGHPGRRPGARPLDSYTRRQLYTQLGELKFADDYFAQDYD